MNRENTVRNFVFSFPEGARKFHVNQRFMKKKFDSFIICMLVFGYALGTSRSQKKISYIIKILPSVNIQI